MTTELRKIDTEKKKEGIKRCSKEEKERKKQKANNI